MTLHTIDEAARQLGLSKRVTAERLRDAERAHPEVTWRDRSTKAHRMSVNQIAALRLFIWPGAYNSGAGDFTRQALARGTDTGSGAGGSTASRTNSRQGRRTRDTLKALRNKPSPASTHWNREAR